MNRILDHKRLHFVSAGVPGSEHERQHVRVSAAGRPTAKAAGGGSGL